MKALFAILIFLGTIGVFFAFMHSILAGIWAFAGLCLLAYIELQIGKAVSGDDDWMPWGGGPVD